MSKRVVVLLKILVHAACLAPVAWLVWRGFQNNLGPDPTHTVTFFTGRATLRLLIITLAISPVRRLVPKMAWLIRFRRMLGLYAFFYGCLHLMTYLWLYAGFSWAAIVDDISRRRFIVAGVAGWVLMVPLALTSTAWSIRKLGGKNWKRLHWLIYASVIAGVTHYWWGVKQGDRTPMAITVLLALVLVARPVATWVRERGNGVAVRS